MPNLLQQLLSRSRAQSSKFRQLLSRHKRLYATLAAVSVMVVGATGGFVAAQLYDNPSRMFSDAFGDLITSRTIVGDGEVNFSSVSGSVKTSSVLKFTIRHNAPNINGQFDADMSTTIQGKTIHVTGSAMLSRTGNFYFKFEHLADVFGAYFGSTATSAFLSNQVKTDIQSLLASIDGKWVKVDQSDVKSYLPSYDYAKAKQCYQAVYDGLAKNSAQKNQLIGVYEKHPFLTVSSGGSEVVNNVKSNKYGVKLKVATYYDALADFDDSDYEKTTKVCDKSLWGESDPAARPSDSEIKDAQTAADKTSVDVWISRRTHQLERTTFTYRDISSGTSNAVNATFNYRPGQSVDISDPTSSIPFQEFQDKVTQIGNEIMQGFYAGADEQTTAPATQGQSSLAARARDTERQTDINSLQKQLEAYYAQNGAYPTFANILDARWRSGNDFRADPKALQDPIGLTDIGGVPASPTNTSRYGYVATPGCTPFTDAQGAAIDSAKPCTEYSLTAWLEAKNEVYTKTNL